MHLGVGATSFGNVCVGLYGLWHNAEFNKKFDQISCDFGLLISNDGLKFREPVKGHRYLRREQSLATAVPGHEFNTILCQANGILNVGDETRIYHGRWRNANGRDGSDLLKYYSGEVALATLPRDRWGGFSLDPEQNEGSITSATMALSKSNPTIQLNADGGRGIKVDILDEHFQPVIEFSGPRGGVVVVDGGLDCPVQWPAGSLSGIAGKLVRLQIQLTRQGNTSPRIYAVSLPT